MDLLIEECSVDWNRLVRVSPSCVAGLLSICMAHLSVSSTKTPWEVFIHSMEIDNVSHGDDHER